MQSYHSLSEKAENQDLYDQTVKINRLLRLFKLCKKMDDKTRTDIESQIKRIKDEMKKVNEESYIKVEEIINRAVTTCFENDARTKKEKPSSSSDLPSFESSWSSKKSIEKKMPSSSSSFMKVEKNEDSSEFSDVNSRKGNVNLKQFCSKHFHNL